MSEEKINVVMGMLHAFVQESARMKAIEIIAKAQYNPENNQNDIETIRDSANEFLMEIKKVPFKSQIIELTAYRGYSPQNL